MRSPLITMISILSSALPIAGQSADAAPPSESGAAFVAGLGFGGGTLGMAGLGYVGASTRLGDFLVRGSGTDEFNVLEDSDASSDVALLYGLRATTAGGVWIRAAAGPSMARTVRYGPRTVSQTDWSYGSYADREETRTLGLALQLDIAWGRRVGVGLALLGDLNGERSFVLAAVSGHLRVAG